MFYWCIILLMVESQLSDALPISDRQKWQTKNVKSLLFRLFYPDKPNFRQTVRTVKTPFYTFVKNGTFNIRSTPFVFALCGVCTTVCGLAFTWYDVSDSPAHNRSGKATVRYGLTVFALCLRLLRSDYHGYWSFHYLVRCGVYARK